MAMTQPRAPGTPTRAADATSRSSTDRRGPGAVRLAALLDAGRARRRGSRAGSVRARVPEVVARREPERVPPRRGRERVPELAVASHHRAGEAPARRVRGLDRARVRRARRRGRRAALPPTRRARPALLRRPERSRDRGRARLPARNREVVDLPRARPRCGKESSNEPDHARRPRSRPARTVRAPGRSDVRSTPARGTTRRWRSVVDPPKPRRSRPAFAAIVATAAAVALVVGVAAIGPGQRCARRRPTRIAGAGALRDASR